MKIFHDDIIICEFESEIERINDLDLLLNEVFDSFNVLMPLQFRIKLCLFEAVNNALIHGNKLSRNKTVIITCIRFNLYLRFTVKDEGLGFNFADVYRKKATLPDVFTLSGRGTHLIHEFCEHVSYFDRGRIIQLDFFDSSEKSN